MTLPHWQHCLMTHHCCNLRFEYLDLCPYVRLTIPVMFEILPCVLTCTVCLADRLAAAFATAAPWICTDGAFLKLDQGTRVIRQAISVLRLWCDACSVMCFTCYLAKLL